MPHRMRIRSRTKRQERVFWEEAHIVAGRASQDEKAVDRQSWFLSSGIVYLGLLHLEKKI